MWKCKAVHLPTVPGPIQRYNYDSPDLTFSKADVIAGWGSVYRVTKTLVFQQTFHSSCIVLRLLLLGRYFSCLYLQNLNFTYKYSYATLIYIFCRHYWQWNSAPQNVHRMQVKKGALMLPKSAFNILGKCLGIFPIAQAAVISCH